MSKQTYCIYNLETTRYLTIRRHGQLSRDAIFQTEPAAKAALTRHLKQHPEDQGKYGILDSVVFQKIEKTHVVKNLMSGKDVVESVNTPNCCSVASETYWSM